MELLDRIAIINPEVYIKGGYVRDRILGIPANDIDFFVVGEYEEQLTLFANSFDWAIPTGRDHGTFMFKYENEKFECTVVNSMTHCALRSDFSINAIMLDSNMEYVDPIQGRIDLSKGIIRQVKDDSIILDPIRAIRGVRFAHKFRFNWDAATLKNVKKVLPLITFHATLSKYRSWHEMHKILSLENAGACLKDLEEWGLVMPFKPFEGEGGYYENLAQSLIHHSAEERQNVYKLWGISMNDRREVEIRCRT